MTNFVFVSGNQKKVEYLEQFLGYKITHHALDLDEIQSLDPVEVVEHKVKAAYKNLKKPVLIEDTSLTFHALGRLPGTFVKFFLSDIGTEGLCRLLADYSDRTATARVFYGYYDGKDLDIFSAELTGEVPNKPRGDRGMGWDPVFVPNGQTKTYAEMDDKEYPEFSIRNRAVQKLKAFLEGEK